VVEHISQYNGAQRFGCKWQVQAIKNHVDLGAVETLRNYEIRDKIAHESAASPQFQHGPLTVWQCRNNRPIPFFINSPQELLLLDNLSAEMRGLRVIDI
jgi:hypothetical protein